MRRGERNEKKFLGRFKLPVFGWKESTSETRIAGRTRGKGFKHDYHDSF